MEKDPTTVPSQENEYDDAFWDAFHRGLTPSYDLEDGEVFDKNSFYDE